MNRSNLDFQIRGFIDLIQKNSTPPFDKQSVAVLPFTNTIVHTKTDPTVIEWWKDPYLATAGLPVGSSWLNLVKPSDYIADPLRAEQYNTTMQLAPNASYKNRVFFGKINFYSSTGTLFFQRRSPDLESQLKHPGYIDGRLWNMSTPDQSMRDLFNINQIWGGISAINLVGANDWMGLQFDGYWILWQS